MSNYDHFEYNSYLKIIDLESISNSDDLVNLDCVCDYVPGISSISNLVDIFQKSVRHFEKMPLENKTHYYKHLENKSWGRCFLGMIPFLGNFILGFLDGMKGENEPLEKEKKEIEEKPWSLKEKSPLEQIEFLACSNKLTRQKYLKFASLDIQKKFIECYPVNFNYASESIKQNFDYFYELFNALPIDQQKKVYGNLLPEIQIKLNEKYNINLFEKFKQYKIK